MKYGPLKTSNDALERARNLITHALAMIWSNEDTMTGWRRRWARRRSIPPSTRSFPRWTPRAPVPAGIGEGVDPSLAVADDDDGFAEQVQGQVIAGLGHPVLASDENPCLQEDPLDLPVLPPPPWPAAARPGTAAVNSRAAAQSGMTLNKRFMTSLQRR